MILRTTLGVLAFVVVAGVVAVGAILFANAISARPFPQAADVRGLVAFPTSNMSNKADKLPVMPTAFAPAVTSGDIATSASPGNQYAAVNPTATMSIESNPTNDTIKLSTELPPPPKPKTEIKTTIKPPKQTNVVLNDAQIATLKQRLKLTRAQERYWPEIEAALRSVVKQIYEANQKAPGTTVPVDPTTPEVERLKTAVTPLLLQMRPDQKAEVSMLARIIGMEKIIAML